MRSVPLCSFLLLLACDSAEPESAPTQDAPAPAVEPRPVPPAQPSPPPTANTDEVDAAVAAVPLHRVARAPESEIEPAPHFRAFSTGAEVFVTLGPRVMRVRADGSLDDDPRWLAGMQSARSEDVTGSHWYVHALGGRWPDDLLMTVVFRSIPPDPVTPQQVYRWSSDGWVRIPNERRHFAAWPKRLVPWVDGSVLALRGFAHRGDPAPPSGGRTKQSASGKPLTVVRGPGKAPAMETNVVLMDALESGLLLTMAAVDAADVTHLDTAAETRQVRPLPAAEDRRIEGLRLVDAAQAYAFGSVGQGPALYRFDGDAWTQQDAPPCGASIFDLVSGSDLWAICHTHDDISDVRSGTLWRRHDEVWTQVDPGEPVTAVVPTEGGLWVTTTTGVYGPRAPGSVLECPDNHANAATMVEYGAPAASLQCEHVAAFYVLLDAKAGEVRPTLDAALETARVSIGEEGPSLSIAEIEHRGERRVVLHAETYEMTPKNRKAITSAFGDALQGTFCVDRLHEA